MVYNGTSQQPLFILCWELCVIINVAEVKFLRSKEVLDLDLIRTISPKIDHLRPSETAPVTKGIEVILFTPSSYTLNIDIGSRDKNKPNQYFYCPMHFRMNSANTKMCVRIYKSIKNRKSQQAREAECMV